MNYDETIYSLPQMSISSSLYSTNCIYGAISINDSFRVDCIEELKKENKELRKSLAYLASTVNDLIVEVRKLKNENSNRKD